MENQKLAEILDVLSQDSRTTPETIAQMVGLSVAEVTAAITELESKEIIKRYTTTVDWEQAGIDRIVAFIDVNLRPAREVGFDAIAMRIARFPEVRSMWLVSGSNDLRIMVEATHLRDLAKFVAEKIATIDGVTGTATQFILRRYKEDHALFQEAESDGRLMVSP